MKKLCCALVGIVSLLLMATAPARADQGTTTTRNYADNALTYCEQAFTSDAQHGIYNQSGAMCYIQLYYADYFAHQADQMSSSSCNAGLLSQFVYLFAYRALMYAQDAFLFAFQNGSTNSEWTQCYYYTVLTLFYGYDYYQLHNCFGFSSGNNNNNGNNGDNGDNGNNENNNGNNEDNGSNGNNGNNGDNGDNGNNSNNGNNNNGNNEDNGNNGNNENNNNNGNNENNNNNDNNRDNNNGGNGSNGGNNGGNNNE